MTTNIQILQLVQIRLDGDTQTRVLRDESVVDEYTERMKAGDSFPPFLVFFDGKDYWLVDGFQRIAAADRAGFLEHSCEIRNGTLEDARWECLRSNAKHGLRRSRQDTAHAIEMALSHGFSARLSNVQIAEHLGVATSTIQRHREKLESTCALHKFNERLGKDHKLRRLPQRDAASGQNGSLEVQEAETVRPNSKDCPPHPLPELKPGQAYYAFGENDSAAQIVPHPSSTLHWIVGVIRDNALLYTGKGIRAESVQKMVEYDFGFRAEEPWISAPAPSQMPEWFPSQREQWAVDHHKSELLKHHGRLPDLNTAEEWPPASIGSFEAVGVGQE